MVMFLIVGLILEVSKKYLKVGVTPTQFASFLSYIMMTYTFCMVSLFLMVGWNLAVGFLFTCWSAYGFAVTFTGYKGESIQSYAGRIAAGLILVAPLIYVQSYMLNLHKKNQQLLWKMAQENAASERAKVPVVTPSKKDATVEVDFSKMIRRGPLKKGDVFRYRVEFWRDKKRIHGDLTVVIDSVAGNGAVNVNVYSKFGKKKRSFRKLLTEQELSVSQSMLNRNQKPGHFVAYSLLTTAHVSLEPLPKYQKLQNNKFLKNIKTRKMSRGGISGYEIKGLPNLVYLSSGEREKTTISVSERIGLPLVVKGRMPASNINYKINLRKFEKGRL